MLGEPIATTFPVDESKDVREVNATEARAEKSALPGSSRSSPNARSRAATYLAPVIPLVTVAAVWYFADLGRFNSAEKVAAAAEAVRTNPLSPVFVILAFAIGTLLFFPITALMLGTILAFASWRGFALSLTGAMLGSALTYWIGRLAGGAALDRFGGARVARFRHELRTHAVRASILARLLPVGNFSMINMLAGSLRVPFRKFMLGNTIGLVPGVLFLSLFAEQIAAAIRSPSKTNVTLAIAAGGLLFVLGWLLKRWLARRGLAQATQEGELVPVVDAPPADVPTDVSQRGAM